jgi:16S rRNA (cytosine967-C5)-methyltransferase
VDARRLALAVLERVDAGARSDAELGRELDASELAEPDRSLATRIVYGVLAWRLRLDHTIAALARRRVEALDQPLANILRIGLYQLCFLDRVPPYAAVNSAVDMVPPGLRHAAGFVNAILRRAGRQGLVAPSTRVESERTAIELSHPEWLVKLWTAELGALDALALMRADNEALRTTLRALDDRDEVLRCLRERGVEAEPARFAPQGIRAAAAVTVPGVAVPQGEASQLVALLVGAKPGERILDACAAPGGKTAYLAQAVGPAGSVTAVDAGRGAGRRIAALLELCGVHARIVEDRIENVPREELYDAVLVDAPCSGLGTLCEHPEIRWRRAPDDLADFTRRQSVILRSAALHVRPGGRLVYATCTLTRVENDDIVDSFLAERGDFAASDCTDIHPVLRALVDERCRLRTFPHRHDMAGFFAARMVRAG